MFSLANPLALIALAALAVPVILHLIRRPLPTIRLGSLKFLTESQRRLRSFRWRDLLLLLVRCGLLSLLALLLAAPHWIPGGDQPVRWVLRIPGVPLPADDERRVQTLIEEGYVLHYLAAGFPRQEPATGGGITDAWSLMREADLRLPAGSEWIVVAPLQAANFVGDRPVLRRVRVSWEAVESVAANSASVMGDELWVSKPVRVAVVASSDRGEDARRVRAVVRALAATEHAVIEVSEEPDWIFQLGSVELAPAWEERVRKGATLVTDAPVDAALAGARTFELRGQSHAMMRRGALPVQDSLQAVVIADSVGDPVATLSRLGEGWQWRFAFRFHPDSTSWVLGSGFPAWWHHQMLGDRRKEHGSTSVMDPRQIEPRAEMGPVVPPELPRLDVTDLRMPFWIMALGLLAVERWLASRGGGMRGEASA